MSASYGYDPLGRRVLKDGTGVTKTWFLDDGDDEIAEYDGSRSPSAIYVPGPAIDEPIVRVTGFGGTLAHKYFHTNHQGSVIAMSDDGGNKVEGPYTYDPYGNCFSGATPCGSLANSEPFKFTGRRLDPETGLYYYRARCYIPTLGRFCQTDPVGYTADLNLYTYVGNDPTNKADPRGQCPRSLHGCGGEYGDIQGVDASSALVGSSDTLKLNPGMTSLTADNSNRVSGLGLSMGAKIAASVPPETTGPDGSHIETVVVTPDQNQLALNDTGGRPDACLLGYSECLHTGERLHDLGYKSESHTLYLSCRATLSLCNYNEEQVQKDPKKLGGYTYFPPNKEGRTPLKGNGGGVVIHQKGKSPVYIPPSYDPLAGIPPNPNQ